MENYGITISNGLIILATMLGPILAVQAQKWLEILREKRNRKLSIFYNLMATRGNRISERHVEALNSIQLEYHDSSKGKARRVKDAWTEYHTHLHIKADETELARWNQSGDELFTNLLHEMAQYLKYDYNRVDIKNGGYTPIAHGNKQFLQDFIGEQLARVLAGDTPIKVKIDTETISNP